MIKKYDRVEYEKLSLNDADVLKNPFLQFSRWWQEAIASDVHLLDAVHLSTVDENHHPNARIVLLKSFDDQGLVFFTNYNSKKSDEISVNPHVCLIIFWPKVERQIRIRGTASKINREESEAYFLTRPRGAQIGAWASPQSEVIKSREFLEDNYVSLEKRFSHADVPCPPHWGGYRVVPSYFEFWQGRKNRLHDRFSFAKTKDGNWKIERLAP